MQHCRGFRRGNLVSRRLALRCWLAKTFDQFCFRDYIIGWKYRIQTESQNRRKPCPHPPKRCSLTVCQT